MASLHQDPLKRSPYWYCAYTLEDGSRKFRSTRKKNKTEAMKICVGWADGAREAGTNDRDLAILNEMRKARGKEPLKIPKIKEHFERWLEGLHVSPGTKDRYKTTIEKFLNFLGPNAEDTISNLTAERIEDFQKSETAHGLAPATVNLDLKIISFPINVALRRGYLQRNVANTVKTLPKSEGKRAAFSLAQLSKLLKRADAEWYGLILIGYYTGLRLGDAAGLTWENIDIPGNQITCIPDKRPIGSTKDPLQEPIHKQLKNWLRLWKSEQNPSTPSAPVFPTLSQKSIHRRNGLSNTFTRMITAAGIANPTAREKGAGDRGRSTPALSFHSLRHTFNTQLGKNKVVEVTRMRLSDHTSAAMNRRYTESDMAHLLEEVNKLPPLG